MSNSAKLLLSTVEFIARLEFSGAQNDDSRASNRWSPKDSYDDEVAALRRMASKIIGKGI